MRKSKKSVVHLKRTNSQMKPLSAALNQSLDRLYDVFGHCHAPKAMLDVCIACCMDADLEKEMRRVPLHKLTEKNFYAYNGTAKSRVQPVDELRYFLPRLLELLAEGAELHHSTELYLERLGNCDWSAFSPDECAAIDAFALAYWSDFLATHPWHHQSGYSYVNAFDILLMFDLGGVSLKPLLALWLSTESAASSLHYVVSGYWNFWEAREINMTFAKDRPAFCATMKAWLMDAACREIFSARLIDFDVSQLNEANHIDSGAQLRPQDLINGVIQKITW